MIKPVIPGLMLAVDTPDWNQALRWVQDWAPYVGALKLGPRLILGASELGLQRLNEDFQCFWDFKFYDIPSTLLANVRKAFELGACWVSVSAWAYNPEVWLKLKDLEARFSKNVVLVAGLTSQDSHWWSHMGIEERLWKQRQWELWQQAGLSWVVVAGPDLTFWSSRGLSLKAIVPGIRWDAGSEDDQKKTITPYEVLEYPVDWIVLGRAFITQGPQERRFQRLWQHLRSI